ncbi:DUF836-domain-containing protein [Calocera cornea HHB12733]|uniref:Glutaredoxin-like protein n=1 Tax=Calocera cornea HHB12733 TaxID=1353952 RepID=A0A165DA31_9BASI|nr:DUF836-domain-containing protein [Calocera cornea HHB12733]
MCRAARLPRLTLYTGPFCSLCDTAKAELAKVQLQSPFHLTLVDIHAPGAEHEKWRRLYQYDIPVLHLEGRRVMKHRVEGERLVQKLDEWRRAWEAGEVREAEVGGGVEVPEGEKKK